MKGFLNLKIGVKLLAGFILVAIIAGAMGAFAIVNIKTLDDADTELYEHMTVPIALMATISSDFQRSRVNMRDMLLADDPKEIEAFKKRIDERRASVSTLSKQFEALIIDDEMQDLYDKFLETRVEYGKALDLIVGLAQANRDDEGLAALAEDQPVGIASREEQEAIAAIVAMQVEDAGKKAADNTVKANATMLTMVIVLVVVMILSILLGIILSSLISKPLKQALVMIQEMGKGHLGMRLKMDTKDEVGQMAKAMDEFADSLQNVTVKTVQMIAAGDMSAKVTVVDDKDEISPALQTCINAVSALVSDAAMLSVAAVEGRLDTRADASKHGGDFRKIVEGVNKTLDSVIGPLNVAAEYVDRISKGDIPPKITDKYNGDFNEIKNNLNVCIDAVNALVADAATLSVAAQEGRLDTRADASKHGGDFRKIVEGVNKTLDSVIGPLNVAAEYVDRISKGDIPPKITDKYNGDFNEIKNNLNMCIDAMNQLIQEMGNMSTQHDLGDIDVKVNEEKFQGVYRQMAAGVNTMVFGHIAVKKKAMACLAEFGNGNFEAHLERFPGKKVFINEIMEQVRTNLKALIADATMLSVAAQEGRLDTRADASKHGGDFRKIVDGVNKTLDSVIGPLNVAAEYVDRISKGDIPPKITDKYNGDFNEIKNNLNMCIDAMNQLIQEMGNMSTQHDLGDIDIKVNEEKFQGVYRQMAAGVNTMVFGHIAVKKKAMACLAEFGNGNFEAQLERFPGKKVFINEIMEQVRANLKALIADATMLSVAAVEGKLDTRADASKHGGDFRKIVEGVNKTLDSVIGPLNVAAEYMDRISKGDIPTKITDRYNGDFNEIKNNINVCIDAVNALVADAAMLTVAAVEGKLSTRADATKHGGDFRKIVEGVNKTLDAVIKPVNEAAAVLKEMAAGSLQTRVKGDYQGDHAEIKIALNSTLESLSEYVNEITSVLSEMANANIDMSITSDYRGDFSPIKKALNLILDSFNQTLSDINTSADQVAEGSRQVSDGSQTLSRGATGQASAVEQLTASINDIAEQTRQNAVNANKANELAGTAHVAATQGNVRMKEMQKAMEEINDSSANISKIIKVIDEIAFQTNILALNAAVEAAHAGQHGKGFAVVAEEVRSLAARSASAAKETSGLIEGSIKKVEIGTHIANDTAQALDRIVVDVAKAAELVGSIAAASNEQATGIAQINTGVEQVSKIVQANSATSEQSAQASEELSGQAELLKGMISSFRLRKTHGSAALAKRAPASRDLSKGKADRKSSSYSESSNKPEIILSDVEFGKY